MDARKKLNYGLILNNNGIDTLSGLVEGLKSPTKQIIEINQCNYRKSEDKTYVLINPNKSEIGEKLINGYSGFLARMRKILSELGADANELDLIRCDFCYNSTFDNFDEYKKLHRLLISCLAKAYNYKNCYVSSSLWTFDSLSICIKKDDSEAENYNKRLQSEGKDESSNRLELRSKRLRRNGAYREVIPDQVLNKWFERLDNALKCFDAVQQEYNDNLERLYKADKQKPASKRDYLSLNAFLLQFKECIYTRQQMIDLLTRLQEVEEYQNPRKRADRFKEQYHIEYFSRAELRYVVEVLKDKAVEYFKS